MTSFKWQKIFFHNTTTECWRVNEMVSIANWPGTYLRTLRANVNGAQDSWQASTASSRKFKPCQFKYSSSRRHERELKLWEVFYVQTSDAYAQKSMSQTALKYWIELPVKGVVHFKKKKTFADNLLTPMSSKISMSFFLQSKRNVFDENIPEFSSI